MTALAKFRLPAILLAALLLRGVFAFGVVGTDAMVSDEPDYHRIAANLAAGHGFVKHVGIPTALRPPAYPVLLAGAYRVFGPSLAVGRGLQVLLGVLLVFLIHRLARSFFDEPTALLAAAVAAVHPFLIFMSGYLMTENLYTVLTLVMALGLRRLERNGYAGAGGAALMGVLAGVAALTRPPGVLLGWIAAGIVVFRGRGPVVRRLLRAGALVGCMALAVAPWAIRNQVRLGERVLFTTHGGITFYQGNNQLVLDEPAFHGGVVVPRSFLPGWESLSEMGETEFDARSWELGLSFLREHPGEIPLLEWRKLVRFWRLSAEMGVSGIKSGYWWNKNSFLGALVRRFDPGAVFGAFLMPAFLLGLGITRRRWRELAFLYGMVLTQMLVALVFFGSLRTRIPVEPVIVVLGAFGWVRIAAWVRGRGARRPGSG